jgi:hypothetical protein
MRARTIGDLLAEFEPQRKPGQTVPDRVVAFERRNVRPTAPAVPLPKEPSKEEEAYERGKKDGHAAAISDCENKLREYGLESARRRAEERERWVAEQASVLARQLQDGLTELEARLSGTIGRLIEPWLVDKIRQEALDGFIIQLNQVIRDNNRSILRIGGPIDLLDAIRSKIDGKAAAVQYVAQAGCEVRLVSDQVILETQMQVWIDRLKQAMA